MTVFIFTDKVQKLLGVAKGNLYYDVFLILISLAVVSYAFYKKPHHKTRYIVVGSLFLLLCVNWFIGEVRYYKYLENEYSKLTTIYREQEYKVVEGFIEVLHEQPEGGHDAGDIFRIDEIEFELSCFSDTFGYNRTIVYGGALTEGVFARVYYYQEEGQTSRDAVIMQIDMLEKIANPVKLDPLLPCAGY